MATENKFNKRDFKKRIEKIERQYSLMGLSKENQGHGADNKKSQER